MGEVDEPVRLPHQHKGDGQERIDQAVDAFEMDGAPRRPIQRRIALRRAVQRNQRNDDAANREQREKPDYRIKPRFEAVAAAARRRCWTTS